jgi:hypothetical protein
MQKMFFYCKVLEKLLNYEGESNENLKNVINIWFPVQVGSTVTNALKNAQQVAAYYRQAKRCHTTSLKWLPHLWNAPMKNNVLSYVFWAVKVWNLLKSIGEWKSSMVRHVYHCSKCTSGVGSSETAW